jgi:hypothetical protein
MGELLIHALIWLLFTAQPGRRLKPALLTQSPPVGQKMANWTAPYCSLAQFFLGSCEESNSSIIAKHWGRGPG